MKRSLSQKYFSICIFCVFLSVLILGILFLVFSTRFFEKDKYGIMQRNAHIAATITANSYIENNYNGINETTIFATYTILSNTTGSDFMLSDNNGHIVYHSDPLKIAGDMPPLIPLDILAKAKYVGYRSTGVINGITSSVSYIVGEPVIINGETVATVLVVNPATELFAFIGDLTKKLLIAAGIVLLISFVILYYLTSRMVQPLKQMVDATHSFSEGDFSKRIPVYTQDEIGQLAMAFNNMASTLAINENSRRSFIANVSHELKTPMTTIGGFVDGILDRTIPYEKQDHYLMIVSSEVKRLSRLVHSMLDTARIDAGEMKIKKINFDISELVRKSTFTFEQIVEEKKVRIIGLEQDKEMVCADKDLIHQVVYNLMENAVKFVNVEGEISVRYEKRDGKLYTTIRNTGEGLSKEESAQIFERFYKSDRSRSGHRGGVGLGLHIVKSIINYHNGELAAYSEVGKYTEFTFGIDAMQENNKTSKVG